QHGPLAPFAPGVGIRLQQVARVLGVSGHDATVLAVERIGPPHDGGSVPAAGSGPLTLALGGGKLVRQEGGEVIRRPAEKADPEPLVGGGGSLGQGRFEGFRCRIDQHTVEAIHGDFPPVPLTPPAPVAATTFAGRRPRRASSPAPCPAAGTPGGRYTARGCPGNRAAGRAAGRSSPSSPAVPALPSLPGPQSSAA